ncbi:hypothetical protein KJ636_00920 [Patescibacteria group bacterium]|nr:hypothetical protein [Patescibacteria group bacterium]
MAGQIKIKMPKIKKNVIIVSLAVVLIFGGILLWALWQKTEISRVEKPTSTPASTPKVEKTMEEIIIDLTAPQEKAEPLPEKIIHDLTLPQKGKKPTPLSDELIKDLTAPK